MRILVINAGSSSIKYQLFDMGRETILASGLAERIGEAQGLLKQKSFAGGEVSEVEINEPIPDHQAGMERIVDLLTDPGAGIIAHKSDIDAVGHRVVHGGESFHAPCVVDETVIEAIKEAAVLAPLHGPANLTGILVAQRLFPDAVQITVFDTAFHQTIAPHAFLYALPRELYQKHKVRRYGFHGTSHWYVSEKAAEYLGKPLAETRLITLHLGNGASMAAIKGGKCIDTSMGLTPLEGLVMGTRSGDVDPALPFFLANNLGMDIGAVDKMLNKESGLKGLCGFNDMREVIEAAEAGDGDAQEALDVYAHRIRKYIGAYLAELGGLDAIIFTAGIGENAPQVRAMCCDGLAHIGIEVDPDKNNACSREPRDIGRDGTAVRVLVVPTDEELKIAVETQKLLQNRQ